MTESQVNDVWQNHGTIQSLTPPKYRNPFEDDEEEQITVKEVPVISNPLVPNCAPVELQTAQNMNPFL